MQVLLLINRQSRSGAVQAGEVRDYLRSLGVTVVVRDAGSQAEIKAALDSHAESVDCVVVGGGDGTVSMAVAPLLAHDLPIAVIPLGTANDMARTLGVPADIEQACHIAVKGRPHAVDVGQCNDVYFVNVASLGIPVHASKHRSEAAKRWLGAVGYAGNLIQAFRATEPFDAELTWDDHHRSVHTVQLVIGNGRYFGGGMAVARDAVLDDGLFDIYSLAPQSALSMMGKLPGLVRGPEHSLAGVSLFQATAFRITTREPMSINTDGEIQTATPADFRVLPAALRVMVPTTISSAVDGQDVEGESTQRVQTQL